MNQTLIILILSLISFWTVAQNNQVLARIGFGSCSNQDSTAQLWPEILDQKPQLWIWLGDIIYGDTHDMTVLRAKYDHQKRNSDYHQLIKMCAILGTWDDHDYGQNDGGKFFSKKNESKKELLRFLDVKPDDPIRKHPGVYSSHTYGTGRQKIKIILLDTRAFRDTTFRSRNPGRRYDPNPDGDVLGEEQWAWFEQELKNSDAAIHIIGSSIQFISNDHGYEKWGNFPKSRQRMLDVLVKHKIKRPIIISGDRHMAEISKMAVPGLRSPLYDFTSSGLTHTWSSKIATEENQYRVSKLVIEKNFGMLLIDWSSNEPTITFEIRGKSKTPFDTPMIAH